MRQSAQLCTSPSYHFELRTPKCALLRGGTVRVASAATVEGQRLPVFSEAKHPKQ
jgi:hypothetical protein